MSLENKIAALLAKAESTAHPAEAESFMAKAEELMLKHGIERANLAAKRPGQRQEEIVTARITVANGHGYAAAMVHIGHGLAPSFSVRSLQSRVGRNWVLWLVGHESDVEKAKTLFESLAEQSRKQALAWWKTTGKFDLPFYTTQEAYLARREFIYAFARGAQERLAETRNRVVEESEAGTDLVLVDRKKVVDNWIEENMEVGKGRSTNRRVGSFKAAHAGKQAGREAVAPKAVEA